MEQSVLVRAVGMFVITNVDDLVLLALLFSRSADRSIQRRVVVGQYLGFMCILVSSVAATFGAGFLPPTALPYLGLLPLVLGLRMAMVSWTQARGDGSDESRPSGFKPGMLAVAAITFADGGDNIGVYVPVFAQSSPVELTSYCLIFLAMVGVWCVLGSFIATRPIVSVNLTSWDNVVLPAVLVALGLSILSQATVFRG